LKQPGSWHHVCPQCKATFVGLEEFCPHDGTPLVAGHKGGELGEMLGEVLDERFVLQKILGEGGMGIVYLARHAVLDRVFALKLLRRELLGDPLILRRFQREARTASSVVHPNIVHIYDFGRTRTGLAYLVMEYVNGVSLYNFCESFADRQLHVSQAVDITMQVTQALAAAHAHGIVHRDPVCPAGSVAGSGGG
jgi:serine/threonine-protein kinase